MINKKLEIYQTIKNSENIAICFASDLNSLISAFLLKEFIKILGKNVTLYSPDKINHNKLKFLNLHFQYESNLTTYYISKININISNNNLKTLKYNLLNLDNEKILQLELTNKDKHISTRDIAIGEKTFNYDLIITIGIHDLVELKDIYNNNIKFFKQSPIINIDNQAFNTFFAKINYVDINSEITALMIYQLFKEFTPNEFSLNLAKLLLSNLLMENKQNPNIKTKYANLIAELINLGVNYKEIKDAIYQNKDQNYLRLLGQILKNIEIKDRILSTTLSYNYNNEEQLENILEDLFHDILQQIYNIDFIILSIENLQNWQHIIYNVNPEKTDVLQKLQNKYQILNTNLNNSKILIQSELQDIQNLHNDFRKILNSNN